jgi:hypothetical protein
VLEEAKCPRQVDILIINCSLFSPTPPLCAMVANYFQMRSDVQDCSEAAVAVNLTASKVRPCGPTSRVFCCVVLCCGRVVSPSPRL